ncbi:glycoside hydrolase family 16 protein [Pyxidicoccus caerfyrddinensis]|uniref:glycoside hydrolase family 16 protein n=1 Tax=Pyxidicoccus caerfyrddinensis TaxID=2709663 RepID=UPI0013DABEEF|nr:glycoside hydrolase family 16 protein [Pyxidicoccus caerfyrddinensis]
MRSARVLGIALLSCLVLAPLAEAKSVVFSGYQWDVRSGQGGPGPNTWDDRNVWVDANGWLHLKIAWRDGRWTTAELYMPQQRLGFGTYQFKVVGRPDLFDDNVVLGLFNYTRPDVGPDGTNEIDLEFAKWGGSQSQMGNWAVYPAVTGVTYSHQSYPISLTGTYSTHRFQWSSSQVYFQALHGHQNGNTNQFASWLFSPPDSLQRIPQNPLPVHMNLWLFQGQAPKNGQEVEVVIAEFKFIPAP